MNAYLPELLRLPVLIKVEICFDFHPKSYIVVKFSEKLVQTLIFATFWLN